ncbi:ribonuclease P/MRP protein subunit POP5-like [Amphiura filiformis]|uniref:ribonuclease P/MRP protein subunit POP5-like n=1 Tax=Amphiura filiformis TaxID=82378 RepID=UPI003B20DE29
MVRLKKRYFLCEIVFVDQDGFSSSQPQTLPSLKEADVYHAVKGAVEEIYGDYGVGAVMGGLNVKYMNARTNVVLIRVHLHANKILWTSLPFVKKIAKCDCFMKTLHIGGTILSCQKSLLKYNRQQLAVLLKQCKTQEERKTVQDSLKKCTLNVSESGTAFTKGNNTEDDENSDDDDDSEFGD